MREGATIAERYRIVRRSGAGGMGTVYEARDLRSGGEVALKTLKPDSTFESRRASRLVREAEALAEIGHDAVVRYVDHGALEDGSPFLVMDWVEGETLAERLVRAPLTPRESLRLASRLAEGLAASHAADVVHRDLKPSNVMLRGGELERAVIVDFGVARVQSAGDLTTQTGHIGTPRYMAPEQIRSARTVEGRADVFALGCILFECLTGRLCFDADDSVAILAQVLFEPLPVPSRIRGDLPRAVDDLVLCFLDRDPRRRPTAEGAARFASELEESVTGSAPLVSPRSSGLSQPTSAEPTSGTDSDEAPPSFSAGANALSIAVRALPRARGTFVGRDAEREHLVALLTSVAPMIWVWGSPGVGKTRLVVEAVKSVETANAGAWDALVFADLGDAEDADDIVRVIAREARVSLESSSAPEVSLGRALRQLGRVLLIVDKVERIILPLAATLGAFERVAPFLKVVATSRKRWSPPGTIAVEIAPLSTEARPGERSPAATLLVERAGEAIPSSEARSPEGAPDRVERLARALDGIPLAIELAAANVAVLGVDGLLARLERPAAVESTQFDVLAGPMWSALGQSWELLDEEERVVLAQCAVFRGGFSPTSAEAVVRVGASGALAVVRALREHSFLQSAARNTGEPRLSMFGAVREFALRKLRDSGSALDVQRRHAEHYAEKGDPNPKITAPDLASLEHDAENLLAAAEFALDNDDSPVTLGLRALVALEPVVQARGALASFTSLLERALSLHAELPPNRRDATLAARVLQIRARLDVPTVRRDRAREDLEACLKNAEASGDRHREATVLLDLGVARHLDRDLDEARRCYEASLERLDGTRDLVAEGRCLGNLGALRHDEGDFGLASKLYREAIAVLEEAGEARHRGNLLSNLAVLVQETGETDEALSLFERAVELLESVRDARVLAIVLGNFGVFELERDAPSVAFRLFERSLTLLSGDADAKSRALCLGRLGAALALLGRASDAEARLLRAERLAAQCDSDVGRSVGLNRAFVFLARAREARARSDASAADEAVRAAMHVVAAFTASGDRTPSDDARSSLRILRRLLPASVDVPRP